MIEYVCYGRALWRLCEKPWRR